MRIRSMITALAAIVLLAACVAKTPESSTPLESPETIPVGAMAHTAAQPSEVPATLAELKPEHVDFVTVIPPIPPGPQVPRPLYGGRPEDLGALEELLRGLAAARPADSAGADAEHRRVEWLDVHLINGRRIMVRSAWTCHAEDNGARCATVPGKFVIAEGERRTVVESPELEAFMGEGRAVAMPTVNQMTREPEALVAGGRATVTGDGWGGASAFRLTLERADGKVTLAEGVTTFGSFSWTGRLPADLRAGEYMLQLRLDTGQGVGHPVQVGASATGAPATGAFDSPVWAPDPDHIAWAQVRFGLPSPDASSPLYPGRPSDLRALTRIGQWLRAAKPVDGEISTPSRDASLQIRLKDGRTATVRLAHNCVTAKTATSTRITCSPAAGEVIVHPPAGDPLRLQAPELAAWLRGGWRTDAPTAPQLEVNPLPGGRFRVQGNGWPEADLMHIWLDGEGPGTCCPPSNGARLAAVPVILGRFIWEGEVPGNGPFGLTVVAEGGGARGIQVDR